VTDEVKRLFSRARRRWLLVLALTVVISGLFTLREARKQRMYSSTVVLSATEGDAAEDGVAHTSDRFQDYVYHAVFTDTALRVLLEKYEFRPDMQKKNPRLAVEMFRDLIDVDVYKNEFTAPRYAGSPARSARIAISVRYTDPEQALLLARDLGDLVVTRDAQNRKERFEIKVRIARDAVSYAVSEIERLSSDLEIARRGEEFIPERAAEYHVKAQGAEKGIVAALERYKEAEAEKRKLEFADAADSKSLELHYDRVDWGFAALRENRALLLTRTALFTFFGLLPILALTVGAFDPRIYDERDVARLKLKPLGWVRRNLSAKSA
jgi:hypothetical protein